MRDSRFTFLCDETERELLARLSARLARTQSDAVRWLIREAARELESQARPGRSGESTPAELVAGC